MVRLTDGDILAAERAQKKLQMALEKGIDPVPCHRCGWFQRDMVFQARKLHHRWMKIAGVVCFFVAILMYVLAGISFRLENGVSFFTIFFAVLGGLAALSVPVLPLLKYLLCHKYDPNYDTALAQLRNIPKTPPQIIILNWNNKTSKPFEDEASNPRTTEKNPSFSGKIATPRIGGAISTRCPRKSSQFFGFFLQYALWACSWRLQSL